MFSKAYITHLEQGPFPGQIDPWAEAGRYFQQLHGALIGLLIAQIREPLLALGYIAGREASLQIAEQSKPDIFVHKQPSRSSIESLLDYAHAAEVALAEPGIMLEVADPELEAIFIRQLQSGDLVTVVEIVSPRNKSEFGVVHDYVNRRARLGQDRVHVVEIDLTRSIKRLVQDVLVERYPYHIAIHLHHQLPRFIGSGFGESLKRWALPLRTEVIGVDMQAAYENAYQQNTLAGQILRETAYSDIELPFPSLLSPEQREAAVRTAQAWRVELERLQST